VITLDHRLLRAHAPQQIFPVGPKAANPTDGRPRVAGKGYWTRYKSVEAAGLTELTVEPRITVTSWDGGQDWTLRLDLGFDPTVWDTDRLGLVYGDPTFQAAVQAWWAKTGFAVVGNGPTYTEQGAQEDDSISMECGTPPIGQWSDLFVSAHQAMQWLHNGPAAGWTIELADGHA
jgi:hypothetical protein